MNIDLIKTSKYIGALTAIGVAIWQIISVIISIVHFIDKINNLEIKISDMYTRQETQFLIKLSQTE